MHRQIVNQYYRYNDSAKWYDNAKIIMYLNIIFKKHHLL